MLVSDFRQLSNQTVHGSSEDCNLLHRKASYRLLTSSSFGWNNYWLTVYWGISCLLFTWHLSRLTIGTWRCRCLGYAAAARFKLCAQSLLIVFYIPLLIPTYVHSYRPPIGIWTIHSKPMTDRQKTTYVSIDRRIGLSHTIIVDTHLD